jgi:hypothetical protein
MKTLLLLLTTLSLLQAAPAFHKMRTFTNSDGETFKAQALGNQHLHWFKTQDGEILKYNEQSKNFEYATIEDETLKPSGVKYERDNSKRARSLGRVNKVLENQILELWVKKQKKHHEKKERAKQSYR